ncbi:hypothetical protein BB560_005258 [Smittium megazygosporum]|uniref:General negative regulator of transcription subunit n=1 Tax=Smittium megazygosporum TaxID=133381 RepID=A0A2T9Z745_9FUNG|nr:hypothetical protein BB560_005258 [Smittium megazygosporum]
MSRKLQAEIDRVLKKVSEGVDEFETFCEKIQNATSQSLKEKHEAELKKEIKKLQRLRDQIKSWIQNSDIKDKQDLIHHRKLIEKQMERFKAIEKEMKTKAYSKEGLSQSAKMDPREKQKLDILNWLSEMIDKLTTQIDVYEAEAEQLGSSLSKKKKDHHKLDRIKSLDERIDRHKEHIDCLERIQRLFENESLTIDQIQRIQEDVAYYVEENGDDDFIEDESIYDDLDLDNVEMFTAVQEESSSSDESDSLPPEKPAIPEPKPVAQEAEINIPNSDVRNSMNLKINISIPPAAPDQRNVWKDGKDALLNNNKVKESNVLSPNAPTPKISLAPSIISAPPKPQVLAQPWATIASQGKNAANTANRSTTAVQPQVNDKTKLHASDDNVIQKTVKHSRINSTDLTKLSSKTEPESTKEDTSQNKLSQPPEKSSTDQTSKKAPEVNGKIPSNEEASTVKVFTGDFEPVLDSLDSSDVPESLKKLYNFYLKTKQNYEPLSNDSVYRKSMIDLSLNSIPNTLDQERLRSSLSQQLIVTPSYYPQTPLSAFNQSSTYSKLSAETLFFIFYYQKNTYNQYLASRELKKQNWRFHNKYMTWFKRFDEPTQKTKDYEKGTYLYFDYEESWTQKKKQDFALEYKYLE